MEAVYRQTCYWHCSITESVNEQSFDLPFRKMEEHQEDSNPTEIKVSVEYKRNQ